MALIESAKKLAAYKAVDNHIQVRHSVNMKFLCRGAIRSNLLTDLNFERYDPFLFDQWRRLAHHFPHYQGFVL